MEIAGPSFQDLKRLLPAVLKRSGVMLVLLHCAREISMQLLTYAGTRVQATGREDMPTLIGIVALNFFFEILWSAVWSFVLISATRAAFRQEPIFTKSSLKNLNQVLVEGTRAMAAVLYRLPFLVIPGLLELLRLLFVPHVVLLDPGYGKGAVDALKRSREAIKAKWGLVLVVTLVSLGLSTLCESIAQANGDEGWFWQQPLLFLVSVVLTLAISLVYEIYLVAVFLRLTTRFATEA